MSKTAYQIISKTMQEDTTSTAQLAVGVVQLAEARGYCELYPAESWIFQRMVSVGYRSALCCAKNPRSCLRRRCSEMKRRRQVTSFSVVGAVRQSVKLRRKGHLSVIPNWSYGTRHWFSFTKLDPALAMSRTGRLSAILILPKRSQSLTRPLPMPCLLIVRKI